jgi:hypothetical protein
MVIRVYSRARKIYAEPSGIGTHSIRTVFDLFLRIIEVFLVLRLVSHFFSEDGYLAGMASDISKFLEYINFYNILPASSGIEKPLAFLLFVLVFMLIGYTLIVFFPKSMEKRSER